MAKVDLNTATVRELMRLRGVGPARAAQIVAARPFLATGELVSRGLLPELAFARVAAELIAGSDAAESRACARERRVLAPPFRGAADERYIRPAPVPCAADA